MPPLTRSVVAKFNSVFRGNPHCTVSLSPIALSSAAVNSFKFRRLGEIPLPDGSVQVKVIEAVNRIFGSRCVAAGGFPTFLLGKTTEYGDINFVLMYESTPSELLWTRFFVDLVRHDFARELDGSVKWCFEAVGCTYEDINDLPEHISMTFSEDPTTVKLKLYGDGILVADFSLFEGKGATNEAKEPLLLEIGTRHLHQLAEALREHYDTPLVMNIARFLRENGKMVLECYDLSGVLSEENKLDRRYRPLFITDPVSTTHNSRAIKYAKRLSKRYKKHCTAMWRVRQ